MFPDRKLFLFDTFEGFDERDIIIDKANSYSDGVELSITPVLALN